jgi:hypothetical protein
LILFHRHGRPPNFCDHHGPMREIAIGREHA